MWNKTHIDREFNANEIKIFDDMLEFFKNENIPSHRYIDDLSSIEDDVITYNYECDCTGYYFWWAGMHIAVYKGNFMDEDISVRIYFDDNFYDITYNNKEVKASSFKSFNDIAESLRIVIKELKDKQ